MSDPSRRAVLGSALLAAAALAGAGLGATRKVHHKVAVPPPPAPTELTNAVQTNQLLLAGFDACVAAGANAGTLLPLRAEVDQHQRALNAVLDNYPGWRLRHLPENSASPSRSASAPAPSTGEHEPTSSSASTPPPSSSASAPPLSTVGALGSALLQQAKALTDACVGWPAGEQQASTVVPLLASMAACLRVQAARLS